MILEDKLKNGESVDQQLTATQTLVAKVMSNNDILDAYSL